MKNSVHIENRKVRHNYFILETFISGIVLTGYDVKMIRQGKMSLNDTFCFFHNDELFIKNATIVGDNGNVKNFKLLLKNKELTKLQSKLDKGLSIVPYKVFSNEKGLIKVELTLVRGKKLYDKRESLKEKEISREIMRHIR